MVRSCGELRGLLDGLKAVGRVLAPVLLVLLAHLALHGADAPRVEEPAATTARSTPSATSFCGEPLVEQTFGEVVEGEADEDADDQDPGHDLAPTPIGVARGAEDDVPARFVRLGALQIRGPPAV